MINTSFVLPNNPIYVMSVIIIISCGMALDMLLPANNFVKEYIHKIFPDIPILGYSFLLGTIEVLFILIIKKIKVKRIEKEAIAVLNALNANDKKMIKKMIVDGAKQRISNTELYNFLISKGWIEEIPGTNKCILKSKIQVRLQRFLKRKVIK